MVTAMAPRRNASSSEKEGQGGEVVVVAEVGVAGERDGVAEGENREDGGEDAVDAPGGALFDVDADAVVADRGGDLWGVDGGGGVLGGGHGRFLRRGGDHEMW